MLQSGCSRTGHPRTIHASDGAVVTACANVVWFIAVRFEQFLYRIGPDVPFLLCVVSVKGTGRLGNIDTVAELPLRGIDAISNEDNSAGTG